jgi:dolichol-phosphate mannosyltransferase
MSLGFFTGLDIPPDQSMLKIFDRKVLTKINQFHDAYPFLPVLFARTKMKQGTQLVKNDKRANGKSKYTIKKMLHLTSLAIFYYSYKRLIFFYFTFTAIIEVVTLVLLFYNKQYKNEIAIVFLIILQLVLLLLTMLFSSISRSYFFRIERNYAQNSGYIIRKRLFT